MRVREAVEAAFRKAQVVAVDAPMQAHEGEYGAGELRRMLLAWQSLGYNLWTKASQTVTLAIADRDYTLNPVRPARILNVRLVRNGIETPMTEMTRDEYDNLPVKTSAGTPTAWHYDRQRAAAVLYVWPVPNATGMTLAVTYERGLDDQDDLNATLDVAPEWESAVVYGLADRLADEFGGHQTGRGDTELSLALLGDREGSVFFT